jgi:hypothetical protein
MNGQSNQPLSHRVLRHAASLIPAWLVLLLALAVLPAACQRADAQPSSVKGETVFDCRALAEAVAPFADYRDAGADVERVVARIRKENTDAPRVRIDVFDRELHRLWAEGLPADEAAYALYKRCTEQQGDMGRAA